MTTDLIHPEKFFCTIASSAQAQLKIYYQEVGFPLAEDAESVSIWRHTCRTKWD